MIEAKKVILDTYLGLIINKSEFKKWVNQMVTGNLDCQRIIVSIAIDTHFKLADVTDYAKLFNSLNYHSKVKSPNELLEEAISANATLHFYSKQVQKDKNIEYARVVSLDVLIHWYLNKSSFPKTFVDDDKIHLRKPRFRKRYQNLDVDTNEGAPPKKLVFITNKIEFEAILKSSSASYADIANKYLGLRRSQKEEIAYLIYQNNFDVDVMQPITVNSDMSKEDNVYISFKKHDNCGRTRNHILDEGIIALKEMVHKRINKPFVYNWEYLGIILDDSYNVDKIVTESKNRLNEK